MKKFASHEEIVHRDPSQFLICCLIRIFIEVSFVEKKRIYQIKIICFWNMLVPVELFTDDR